MGPAKFTPKIPLSHFLQRSLGIISRLKKDLSRNMIVTFNPEIIQTFTNQNLHLQE